MTIGPVGVIIITQYSESLGIKFISGTSKTCYNVFSTFRQNDEPSMKEPPNFYAMVSNTRLQNLPPEPRPKSLARGLLSEVGVLTLQQVKGRSQARFRCPRSQSIIRLDLEASQPASAVVFANPRNFGVFIGRTSLSITSYTKSRKLRNV